MGLLEFELSLFDRLNLGVKRCGCQSWRSSAQCGPACMSMSHFNPHRYEKHMCVRGLLPAGSIMTGAKDKKNNKVLAGTRLPSHWLPRRPVCAPYESRSHLWLILPNKLKNSLLVKLNLLFVTNMLILAQSVFFSKPNQVGLFWLLFWCITSQKNGDHHLRCFWASFILKTWPDVLFSLLLTPTQNEREFL